VTCDEHDLGENAGVCRVSTLSFGAHTGTHIDAPIHFGVSPTGVDALPLRTFIGVARVVAIENRSVIEPSELEALQVQPGERLLFKTCNSGRCWRMDVFASDYVYVTPEAAQWLVDRQVLLVGVDYLSVGGMEDGHLTHHALLEGGVSILEGLDLSQVEPGYYEFIALPLRLQGADGAPARAIVRPLG
jgi:arylformamidase